MFFICKSVLTYIFTITYLTLLERGPWIIHVFKKFEEYEQVQDWIQDINVGKMEDNWVTAYNQQNNTIKKAKSFPMNYNLSFS